MFIQLGREAEDRIAAQSIAPAGIWGSARGINRPKWISALKLYRQDQVVEAFQIASSTGLGDMAEFASPLQILDAEARTSEQSLITRINDWLEVETIQGQVAIPPQEIGRIAENAIRQVWSKIGLRLGADTLITLLSSDAVLPGFVDATGYVTLKRPYAKYCLHATAAEDSNRLSVQIQMLAACHAAALISSGMAPPWLISATEALTDLSIPNETRYGFCSGGLKWHEPVALNRRLRGQEFDDDTVQSAIEALDQSVLVGRYLLETGGVKAFRDCLSYHSPASILQYFVLLFSNDPTRDACKKIYGFAPEYLFEQALTSCCK